MRASMPSMFEIGVTIADTYEIEERIGRGGMGIVLRARHTRLREKQVAIKVLDARLANDEMLARFKREAHVLSLLSHPNIVHVEDFNVTLDGTPYLVLEYLDGETLASRLARGAFDTETVLALARQIGSALSAAHARGVIHRDLKPQNVLLVRTDGDGQLVKVLDFGISKLVDSDTVQTADNALLGTPQYMAPEQVSGQAHAIDARSDVFSFGAIVYEMLAGRPAFAGSSLAEVAHKIVYESPPPLGPDVPPQIVTAVRGALAKDKADRFATIGAFVEALTGRRISTPKAPLPPSDPLAATIDSGGVPRISSSEVFAPTVDSAKLPPVALAKPARMSRRWLFAGGAGLAVAAAAGAWLMLRSSPHAELDRDHMRAIAEQLWTSDHVEVDGHRYHVDLVGKKHVRSAKFTFGGRNYEAIEQNRETASHWADLARDGHRVVHFRDLATKAYLAVVVDGEPVDENVVVEEQP